MAVTCSQLSKTFSTSEGDVVALAPLDLSVADDLRFGLVAQSALGEWRYGRDVVGAYT